VVQTDSSPSLCLPSSWDCRNEKARRFKKIFFEIETYSIAQGDLELAILLSLPSKCCNYRYDPRHPTGG
jgi:hypothetical protein